MQPRELADNDNERFGNLPCGPDVDSGNRLAFQATQIGHADESVPDAPP
jgi:hypothetical protein